MAEFTVKLNRSDHTIQLRRKVRNVVLRRTGGRGPVGGVSSVNGRVGDVVLDKTDVGLGNVDNTSDMSKPISSATSSALSAIKRYLGPITGQENIPDTFLRMERIIDPNLYTGSTGTRCIIPSPDPASSDGEITHPSVVYTPEKWNGYYYWMGVTPYTSSNDQYEDPCILASNDGINWEVPAGLTNPLDDQPGGTRYNSDTHLVFGPDNVLHLFWRYLDTSGGSPGTEENIYLRTSTDGITWTPKQLVYQSNLTVRRILSPSFAFLDGQWHMWGVDIVTTKRVVYATSADLSLGSWTTPVDCAVSLPSGRYPWHLFVARVGDQWVGLLNDTSNSDSSGQNGDLILMTSTNGIAWTVASAPCVPRAGTGYTVQYRSSFVPKVVNGIWGLDLWHAVRFPNNVYRTSLTALNYRPEANVQFAKLGIGGAPGTRPLRIVAAAPEMEFVESDNSDKTWHMGVNASVWKVTETGVQDKFLLSHSNQAYGMRYNDTNTKSSGNYEAFLLNPTINHTGTASYVGLYINVTETSTGSGTKLLLRAGVGGSTKFSVDNTGAVTALSYSGSGAALTSIPQSAITNLVTSLASKADDASVVHNTGNEMIAGNKTFTSMPVTYNLPTDSSPGIPYLGAYGYAEAYIGSDGTKHTVRFADGDGDGDVDFNEWNKGNKYEGIEFQYHIRPRIALANGTDYGRLVVDNAGSLDVDGDGTVYVQSGLNYSGTTHADLAFTRYGSPSFHWGRFDASQNGYFILGKNAGQIARARLHAYDTITRIAYFEGGSTSMFISLHALNTTAFDTVGIGATDDDLNLRAGAAIKLTLKATGELALAGGKITNVIDPTAAQDAATKNYVDARILKSGDTMTGELVMTSASTGLTMYNTADQTTNFERGSLRWSSNIFEMRVTSGGTGSIRQILLHANDASTGSVQLFLTRSSSPFILATHSNTGATRTVFQISGTSSASSGSYVSHAIQPTINQSGTASYTGMLVNITETGTGSGSKRLIDLQVGSTSKAFVANTGDVEITTTTAGVILKSPNGARWRITVDNLGLLTQTSL